MQKFSVQNWFRLAATARIISLVLRGVRKKTKSDSQNFTQLPNAGSAKRKEFINGSNYSKRRRESDYCAISRKNFYFQEFCSWEAQLTQIYRFSATSVLLTGCLCRHTTTVLSLPFHAPSMLVKQVPGSANRLGYHPASHWDGTKRNQTQPIPDGSQYVSKALAIAFW